MFDWLRGRRWWDSLSGVGVKDYGTYDEYLRHQLSKPEARLSDKNCVTYDHKYRMLLAVRLKEDGVLLSGMRVLCLGARLGGEVQAFLDLGCFAVGVDLAPGKGNKYVVYGDFNDLQYPVGCVDVVFTNSLDHGYSLSAFCSEVRRVLRPGGLFIAEVVKGISEGRDPGRFESMAWEKVDDMVKSVSDEGFTPILRRGFGFPWGGEHIIFIKNNNPPHCHNVVGE